MAGKDVFRGTQGVILDKVVSDEIWAKTLKDSAIMQASRKITLPGAGISVQTITGDVEADWVPETEEKPVARPTFSAKDMTPYKLAVIVPFSNEFRRDKAALYAECARRLPNALAVAFDKTVMGVKSKPGDNFDQLSDAQKLVVDGKDTYKKMVKVFTTIAGNDANVSAWLATPELQAVLMEATDASGRPLFVPDVLGTGEIGRFLGRPIIALPRSAAGVIGLAGDFANAASYGTVEDISLDMATEATLTDTDGKPLNLWHRNMFALRAEVEIGFRVRDTASFVQITSAASTGSTSR